MDRKRWSSVFAAIGVASSAGVAFGVTVALARIARAAVVFRLLAIETAENERRLAPAR